MKNFAIALVLGITVAVTSCGQKSTKKVINFVQSNGITTPIHQANIGTVQFLSALLPLEEIKTSDFLDHHELNDESNLSIRIFMENSITNYLHELDTTLTAEELLQKGNYQFSFYVDDQLLYTENLNTGAGLPQQKNEFTTLAIPLLSTKNEDSWGRFLWMRFYYRHGGEDALATGKHRLKIEVRPYLQQEQLVVGNVIAKGEIDLQWSEPEVPEEEVAIQSIAPNSGWELSTAPYDTEKIRALNTKIAQNRFKEIASIVVIKNEKLLVEAYFNGANRNTLHDTRSVGKSFASTVTGIALAEGHLKNTDQTLNAFYDLKQYANYSPKKEQVTLKSLLTMSSGFTGNDDNYSSPGNEERMYPTEDWVKFTLDLPMDDAKEVGETWEYFTAGVVVLGDVLHKTVPGGLEKYADQKLFHPLGISDYKWQYTPQHVANTAGGLQMRALDFAKYGQLYKNGGTWKGKQILPSDWVDQTLMNYFEKTPDQTAYGLLFWGKEYQVNGQSYPAFQCSGNGGNKVIIFDDLPLVIVITATAYGQPYGHSQVDKMMERYILPALLN
ncbi:MAG: serine hydrolase [Bacteroidota bacterium]